MGFQLGFILWSLGYSALSLGWPTNWERRSGTGPFWSWRWIASEIVLQGYL
jgi:hypothetical protein